MWTVRFVAWIFGPTLVVVTAGPLWRVLTRWVETAVDRHRVRRWADQPVLPPIERLCADLRRLRALQDAIEQGNQPAKAARLRAASMAYDDVLLQACRALEVPASTEARRPLPALERLRTEADLARAGLRW